MPALWPRVPRGGGEATGFERFLAPVARSQPAVDLADTYDLEDLPEPPIRSPLPPKFSLPAEHSGSDSDRGGLPPWVYMPLAAVQCSRWAWFWLSSGCSLPVLLDLRAQNSSAGQQPGPFLRLRRPTVVPGWQRQLPEISSRF